MDAVASTRSFPAERTPLQMWHTIWSWFPNDRPVFHTPMNGIAVPALKGFAIEKRFFPEKRKGSEKEQEGQR